MEFKEKLRLIKKESGLNQIKFSESIDMDYGHCNKFFTGRKPNVNFLNKLIKVYPDVSLRWLIQNDWETDEVIYEGQKSSQKYLMDIVEIQKQKIESLEKQLNHKV